MKNIKQIGTHCRTNETITRKNYERKPLSVSSWKVSPGKTSPSWKPQTETNIRTREKTECNRKGLRDGEVKRCSRKVNFTLHLPFLGHLRVKISG